MTRIAAVAAVVLEGLRERAPQTTVEREVRSVQERRGQDADVRLTRALMLFLEGIRAPKVQEAILKMNKIAQNCMLRVNKIPRSRYL